MTGMVVWPGMPQRALMISTGIMPESLVKNKDGHSENTSKESKAFDRRTKESHLSTAITNWNNGNPLYTRFYDVRSKKTSEHGKRRLN